nr:gustatory receptor 17 [Papilio memnon]
MAVPSVLVNTYLFNDEYSIDILTKIYIVFGWVIGMNRLPVIWNQKRYVKIASFCYILVFNCCLLYSIFFCYPKKSKDLLIILNVILYFVCHVCAIMFWKTLKSFYKQLSKIDKKVNMEYCTSFNCKINFIQCFCLILCTVVYNVISNIVDGMIVLLPGIIVVHINYILESHYYGHLFGVLESRLILLRKLIVVNYPTNRNNVHTYNEEFRNCENEHVKLHYKNCKMDIRKLMQLYSEIIKAYDLLNAALFQQLLMIVVTTFLTTLTITYRAVLHIIDNTYSWRSLIFEIGITVTEMIPMIVPCVFGERLQTEVQLLRNSLYTRIHTNGFDKSTRSVANYFLALTEVRSLTFSVFRMFEMNLSMFFQLLRVLISYVVIILQFQKVINVDSSNV